MSSAFLHPMFLPPRSPYFPALLLTTLALLTSAGALRAQEDVLYPWPDTESPYRVGLELGANYSLFSRTLTYSPFDNPTSPNHVLGSGSAVGGFVAIAASRDLGERLRVYVKSGFEYVRMVSSGDGIMDSPTAGNFFDTSGVDFKRTVATSFYTGELGLQYDFMERDRGLYASLAVVGHAWGGTVETTDRFELTTPGHLFANGSTVLESDNDDTTSLTAQRYGIHAGLGWQIPISEKFILAPEASFHFMLGSPFINEPATFVDSFRGNTIGDLQVTLDDAALHYIRLGVTLWWRL